MLHKFLLLLFAVYQLMATPEKIIVGISADYPPFEFIKDGEIVGFDVDLSKEIGKQLGVKIEIKEMSFAALINAINPGDIDLIISSATWNEQKSKVFDFSAPYYFDTLAILHKSDSKIDNLNGKSIACQLGTQTRHSRITAYHWSVVESCT